MSPSRILFIVRICSILLVKFHRGSTIAIGTVNQTRLTSVDRLNIESIWLSNQTSPSTCLCAALREFHNVLAFNSYSNGLCQLFLVLPYAYTMESYSNSTLILFSPLPPTTAAPCCSNLTWLMAHIENSSLSPYNISAPVYLVIDDYDYLAVLLSGSFLLRLNRTTMTNAYVSPISTSCTSLSYYNGCTNGNTSTIYVHSTTTLARIANITMPAESRQVVFLRNGTVMVACFRATQMIAFYNVTSPTSYTLTSTQAAPQSVYALCRINDTYLLTGGTTQNNTLQTLSYDPTSKNWTWGTLPATSTNGTNYNFQVAVDPCGQLWVAVRGYGIRIYDPTGSKLLYSWSLSTGTSGIAVHNNFDVYVADYSSNRIYGYRPNLAQCTF